MATVLHHYDNLHKDPTHKIEAWARVGGAKVTVDDVETQITPISSSRVLVQSKLLCFHQDVSGADACATSIARARLSNAQCAAVPTVMTLAPIAGVVLHAPCVTSLVNVDTGELIATYAAADVAARGEHLVTFEGSKVAVRDPITGRGRTSVDAVDVTPLDDSHVLALTLYPADRPPSIRVVDVANATTSPPCFPKQLTRNTSPERNFATRGAQLSIAADTVTLDRVDDKCKVSTGMVLGSSPSSPSSLRDKDKEREEQRQKREKSAHDAAIKLATSLCNIGGLYVPAAMCL